MNSVERLHEQALEQYRAGGRPEAERLCWEVLGREPLHLGAIYLLGVLALDAGEAARAFLHFHHATLLRPDDAPCHNALAEAHRACGRPEEAAESFRTALGLDPALAAAHHGLGLVLLDRGETEAAVASFGRSLALQPDQPRAQTNLGRARHRLGDLEGAAACFREAIRLRPGYAIPHNNLGAIHQARGELDDALAHFRRALALQPDYPEAHYNLGTVLQAKGDPAAAAGGFREAVRLRPDYARAHLGLGQALQALCDFPAALACYRTAARLAPDDPEAHQALGRLLQLEPDWDGARAAFERVLALRPDDADAFCQLFVTSQMLCEWRGWDADLARLRDDAARQIAAGRPTSVQPFFALTVPWSPEQQLAVARSHSDALTRDAAARRERLGLGIGIGIGIGDGPARLAPGERLRVGYLSGDFRDHPVTHLLQGVFGRHDRRSFEVFAYSFGPDDRSPYRERVARDCEHFVDLREASLEGAVRRIGDDRPHLLVDLQGYTGSPRMSLLALRLAPVQVAYLGFPGTTGADFVDYLIGDPIVTPPARQAAYRERLVILPHCYLATDDRSAISAEAGGRADHGLPEGGAVFCAFNNTYKLEPGRFGTWMRILERVPGGVIWLSAVAPRVEANLRREAEARGVAGDRLVFARKVPDKADHVARIRHADLFLDTAYYNGHMTACDALWAGLPVLTRPGETFASRVAASLLVNVGLPELVASDEPEYERTAIRLAHRPEELRRLRARLAANRASGPLFDTPRLARNLERAYRAMWDVHAAGQPPRPLAIAEPAETP